MINIEGLTVTFDKNTVLNNINIAFEKQMVHGIVGLNGAGKTTFFNVMAKTLKPDKGTLALDNKPLSIKDTAYLETVNYFYPGITGNEYLKIFRQTNIAFNLILLQDYFKLPLNDLIENYSTGMKKKLALLGMLKQDRPIYILDEPFNGLDLETNKILEIIITTLQQKNKTIFVSSHIIEPLLTICDKIHLLENGLFVKNYGKDNFNQIDEELFAKLKQEAKVIIANSV